MFLPPCSPDYNPTELALAQFKALLRKTAERTLEALWDAIGHPVDTFSPTECRNYLPRPPDTIQVDRITLRAAFAAGHGRHIDLPSVHFEHQTITKTVTDLRIRPQGPHA